MGKMISLSTKAQSKIGILCAVFHALTIAGIAILISFSTQRTNTLLTIVFQNVICMTIIAVLQPSIVSKVKRTKHYPLHLIRAFFGIGIYLAHYQALKLISPVAAVALLHTAPIFIPLIEWSLFRTRLTVGMILGVLLGFLGVTFILNPRLNDFSQYTGVGIGILSGICFAATFPLTSALRKTESVFEIIFLYSFHSLVISFCLAFYFVGFNLSLAQIGFYLGIGVLNFVQIYLINVAISFIGPSKSGIITNLSTVFVLVLNTLLGKALPDILTISGVLFVIVSTSIVLNTKSHPHLLQRR